MIGIMNGQLTDSSHAIEALRDSSCCWPLWPHFACCRAPL